jgi:hypothetical protein
MKKRQYARKPAQDTSDVSHLSASKLLQTRPFQPEHAPEPQTSQPQGETEITGRGFDLTKLQNFSVSDPSRSRGLPLQAKLTIGAPGDKYEQEADRVANQVVGRLHEVSRGIGTQSESVQRESLPDEEDELQMKPDTLQRESLPDEEDELQMKPDTLQRESLPDEEDELQMKPRLQRRSGGGAVAAEPELEQSVQQRKGKGQPLTDTIRQPMEQAFGGVDFGRVNVHTDTQSDRLNQAIQAKAFTTGQDIFFRQGAYQPESQSGQKLIAHELTHVVQQNGEQLQSKPANSIARTSLAQKFPESVYPEKQLASEKQVIQRFFGKKRKKSSDDEVSQNDDDVQQEIDNILTEMPESPEEQIPDPGQVKQAISSGKEAGQELEKLVKGKPNLAQVITESLQESSQGEQGGSTNTVDPNVAKKAQKKLDKFSSKETAKKGVTATYGVVGGIRTGVSTVAGGLPTVAEYLEKGKKITESATNVVTEVSKTTGTVASIVGIVMGAITAIFDLRSAISSGMKSSALKDAAAQAKKMGHDPEIVNAVEYAAEQKYGKAVRRTVNLVGGILATGASTATLVGGLIAGGIGLTALLASNPVGWGIAVGILAIGTIIGVGLLIYKIGRWIHKKRKGVLSEKRQDISLKLYKGVLAGDTLATQAVNEIGLNAQAMKDASTKEETSKEVRDRQKNYLKYVGEAEDKVTKLKRDIAKLELDLADKQRRGKADVEGQTDSKETLEIKKKLAEKQQELTQAEKAVEKTKEWKAMPKKQREQVHHIMEKLKK